jgi:toxin-antitoxin system PIN domain toxin
VKYLADVNVLFPLLISRHQHRQRALEWFDSVAVGEVALPRIVRLGLLRLLSTPQIMGPDVLSPAPALTALQKLEDDERIALVHEPDGVDGVIGRLVAACATTPNLWTDAYLAAFAITCGLRLISFDRGFKRFDDLNFQLLSEIANP